MTTAWAHLPNAAHIDRIRAHVKAHPDKWAAARAAARWAANREAARATARWDAALNEVRVAAWDAARWDADWAAARSVAWDAILALITWDDAGGPLSLPIEAVKAMADEGNHAAVLIYPAMLAMEENNQ